MMLYMALHTRSARFFDQTYDHG